MGAPQTKTYYVTKCDVQNSKKKEKKKRQQKEKKKITPHSHGLKRIRKRSKDRKKEHPEMITKPNNTQAHATKRDEQNKRKLSKEREREEKNNGLETTTQGCGGETRTSNARTKK